MQRGGGRGGFRGGRSGDRGRGGGRSFGGGRGGGGRGWVDYGPPDTVVEAGVFEHPCEGEAVCKLSNDKVSGCWQRYQARGRRHRPRVYGNCSLLAKWVLALTWTLLSCTAGNCQPMKDCLWLCLLR